MANPHEDSKRILEDWTRQKVNLPSKGEKKDDHVKRKKSKTLKRWRSKGLGPATFQTGVRPKENTKILGREEGRRGRNQKNRLETKPPEIVYVGKLVTRTSKKKLHRKEKSRAAPAEG